MHVVYGNTWDNVFTIDLVLTNSHILDFFFFLIRQHQVSMRRERWNFTLMGMQAVNPIRGLSCRDQNFKHP